MPAASASLLRLQCTVLVWCRANAGSAARSLLRMLEGSGEKNTRIITVASIDYFRMGAKWMGLFGRKYGRFEVAPAKRSS